MAVSMVHGDAADGCAAVDNGRGINAHRHQHVRRLSSGDPQENFFLSENRYYLRGAGATRRARMYKKKKPRE